MLDRPLVDTLSFRPSGEVAVAGDGRLDPVELTRQRLLELEAAIERRYLKAPLGQSKESTLQKITEKQEEDKDDSMETDYAEDDTIPEKMDFENNKDDEKLQKTDTISDDTSIETEEKQDEDVEEEQREREKTKEIPRGLQSWREAVKNAKNSAQLAMSFYVLETSIAWDKSIMKASCQFCHGGQDESALLLCDGCDKGYHTYCFKPAITVIPEGDW